MELRLNAQLGELGIILHCRSGLFDASHEGGVGGETVTVTGVRKEKMQHNLRG